MRLSCIHCYWQRPKKKIQSRLSLWGQKMRNLSQGRAWCVVAAAQGTVCYEVFAGHIFRALKWGKVEEKAGGSKQLAGRHACFTLALPQLQELSWKRGASCIFPICCYNPIIKEGRHLGTVCAQPPCCWQDTTPGGTGPEELECCPRRMSWRRTMSGIDG